MREIPVARFVHSNRREHSDHLQACVPFSRMPQDAASTDATASGNVRNPPGRARGIAFIANNI